MMDAQLLQQLQAGVQAALDAGGNPAAIIGPPEMEGILEVCGLKVYTTRLCPWHQFHVVPQEVLDGFLFGGGMVFKWDETEDSTPGAAAGE